MLCIEEKETIILINKADMNDGFFKFYTTEKREFNRLKKKIGLNSIKNIKITDNTYACDVSSSCWSKTFSIRKKRVKNAKATEVCKN